MPMPSKLLHAIPPSGSAAPSNQPVIQTQPSANATSMPLFKNDESPSLQVPSAFIPPQKRTHYISDIQRKHSIAARRACFTPVHPE